MGRAKTYLASLFLLAIAAFPLRAVTFDAAELARNFASCLGRYSATMEHEWLLGRDGAQASAARRQFEALLEAVAPDARMAGLGGAQFLHIRIEAKQAQAQLLTYASFGLDPRRARLARANAERLLDGCRMLVPD